MGLTKDQQRCVATLDKAIVVAAGAGSGKTHTLTARIVHAVASGYVSDLDEICAITFTKKAAAELKSRIKAELRKQGLVEQALKADGAWVSTIHGMCARILRAHALELGIDPAFSVIGDAEVARYRERAIDEVLVRAQSSGRSPKIDALFREYPVRSYGFGGASVAGMLGDLVGNAAASARGADAFVMPGITLSASAALAEALETADNLLEAAESINQSATCLTWMEAARSFADEAREALDRGVDDYGQALAIASRMKFDGRIGSKDFKAYMAESKMMFGMYVMEMSLGAARPHLETLVELVREVLAVYRELKRADGALDNDDLLVATAHAFENHPAIAARYTDKFKLVMIDEFQDTGQMEVDMVKRFAGENACRLCTVGDAQQSIYRFRSADVSVYRRHLDSVRAHDPDAVIELSKNFRSHADVLSFVDCIFGKPDMFGKEFMALDAGRDEEKVEAKFGDETARITVLNTTCPYKGVSSEQVVEASARRVAREFARLKDAGHSAGEMAVLLGRMKNSGVYAQALRDEGLPCVISGGSVFSSTPEAVIVRCLVRLLANPFETKALFNVLTSPLFGLTSNDVLKVGGLSAFVEHACSPEEGEGDSEQGWSLPLQCACTVMRTAWASVASAPLSQVANRVIVDSGWVSRMQAEGPEGLASAANAFKALRMLEEVERSKPYGPVSAMQAFEAKLDNAKEAPGALSVSDSDSVRIMTVHASKGLEFPIVAVAEFKEGKLPGDCLLTTTVNGAVYLSLNLSRSLADLGLSISGDNLSAMADYILGECGGEDDMAALVEEDAGALHRLLAIRGHIGVGDEEEANRLLYVALTRAKEALVVSMTGKRTKDDPNGIPKSAFCGVALGLDPTGDAFAGTRTMVDFGGSAPAVVEVEALDADSGEACASPVNSTDGDEKLFAVPEFGASRPALQREATRSLHEGMFSYSSIADNAHGKDVLDRLAGDFTVSVDEAAGGDDLDVAGSSASSVAPLPTVFPEDDFYDIEETFAFDDDRATDLGTAFHRLAQYAVLQRTGAEPLVTPPRERVDSLARTCRLDGAQRQRLEAALARWFASDLAHDMARLPVLSAEVPFVVAVGDSCLEGEIDLLGFDEERAHAYVVDYKTGGSMDETADELRCKHVLQASCYAYAILLQGVSIVDAVFVRVERPRADNGSEPQCVRYRFEASDLLVLEQAIVSCASR